jgi:GxxExxY protein
VSAPVVKPTQAHPPERSFAKADYLAAVERAKEMIAAGDFMQVQVGQRISKRYTESPLSLYRALRSLNPSPYMYYYHLGDFHVVGASPEILVRQENTGEGEQKITIRPLAGTRPRGASIELDKAAEVELINDPKERAEHVMLIDLARNDIGRIAKTGTVKVTEAFAVERYSHVMHIVSNVEGTLKDGMTAIDVLKATFPAGTLTGAPKVHAMELIDQLEPTKRGLYGGACGYISYAGDMDVAIAIRTGIVKDQMLHVQAAAGVVADSVPELEWKETEAKARALLRAAELVEEGLGMSNAPDIQNDFSHEIIGAAVEVQRVLGTGLDEGAYAAALAIELAEREIGFTRDVALAATYKGRSLGEVYRAGFVIEQSVIVELKAVDVLTDLHRAQVLAALRLSGLKLGLLINFNVFPVVKGVHRIVGKP